MSKNLNVLLLVNLPQRDLGTDMLIAEHLDHMGHNVHIAPFLPKPRNHVIYFKPDVVIGPEPRSQFTIDFYAHCMEWGIWTIAKRTEGGTSQGAWDVMGKDEKDTVIGAWPYKVDFEVVWSEAFAQIVKKHGYGNNLFVAGALPFDPYFVPPFYTYDGNRRNLTVAAGWGHADTNSKYNVPEAPPESSIHGDAYRRHRKGREAYIELLNRLNKEFGQTHNLQLRLKVGESPEEYKAKCQFPMRIFNPVPPKDVLLNTDILVHAGSTMGLEAHICGLPAFSYLGNLNQTEGYTAPEVSPEFGTLDELVSAIRAVELGKSNANTQAFSQYQTDLFGKIDGKATKRTADLIGNLPKRPVMIPDVWPPERNTYEFPGISKEYRAWVCETCDRQNFTLATDTTMLKCIHCGISLCLRKG